MTHIISFDQYKAHNEDRDGAVRKKLETAYFNRAIIVLDAKKLQWIVDHFDVYDPFAEACLNKAEFEKHFDAYEVDCYRNRLLLEILDNALRELEKQSLHDPKLRELTERTKQLAGKIWCQLNL